MNWLAEISAFADLLCRLDPRTRRRRPAHPDYWSITRWARRL